MLIHLTQVRGASTAAMGLAVSLAVAATFISISPSSPSLQVRAASAAPVRASRSKKPSTSFEYKVSDCLESDRESSLRLVLSEGAVSFNHVLKMNCVAATRPDSVKVVYSRHGHALEVSVVLRSHVLAECECPIEVEGTISGLEKGTYHLSFAYDFNPDESSGAKPVKQSLGTKEITIK